MNLYIGISVKELVAALRDAFGDEDPRPSMVQQQLETIYEIHSCLIEWKQLHNHCNKLVTDFGQFGTQVNSLFNKVQASQATLTKQSIFALDYSSVTTLIETWKPLDRKVEQLLEWSPKIQYIKDENWAVEFRDAREDINEHLKHEAISKIDARQWSYSLWEKKLEFEHIILKYLEIADDNLQSTAEALAEAITRPGVVNE